MYEDDYYRGFELGDLVDAVVDWLVDREHVAVLDPNMDIWDAVKMGDGARLVNIDKEVMINIKPPWSSDDTSDE